MDMQQVVMADTPKRPETDLKGFSCLSCRQRKVKCDRRTPCLNCVKAERQCSFVAPVRGKRKRTKPPRETLHARVKRYEEMLKAYGAKIEPCDDSDMSETETEVQSITPESSGSMSVMRMQGCCIMPEDIKPKFIIKEGASRYFDRYGRSPVNAHSTKADSYMLFSALWSNLSDDVSEILSLYPNKLFTDFNPSIVSTSRIHQFQRCGRGRACRARQPHR